MKGIKDCQAAAIEAFQEAGVRGRIAKHPLGAYTYEKRLAAGLQPCRVMVYRLSVDTELDAWREEGQRTRRWFGTMEASSLVIEPGLAAMILNLDRPDSATRPTRSGASVRTRD